MFVAGVSLTVEATDARFGKVSEFDGLKGVGVDGRLRDDSKATLLDETFERISVRFSLPVQIDAVRLAGFSDRATDGSKVDVNHVEIQCGRDLGDEHGDKIGLQFKNVMGDIDADNRIIKLDGFGVVNYCSFEYRGGPGFALSAISWVPYQLVREVLPDDPRFEEKFIKALRKQIEDDLDADHPRHHKH